jgi:hypothetical protein
MLSSTAPSLSSSSSASTTSDSTASNTAHSTTASVATSSSSSTTSPSTPATHHNGKGNGNRRGGKRNQHAANAQTLRPPKNTQPVPEPVIEQFYPIEFLTKHKLATFEVKQTFPTDPETIQNVKKPDTVALNFNNDDILMAELFKGFVPKKYKMFEDNPTVLYILDYQYWLAHSQKSEAKAKEETLQKFQAAYLKYAGYFAASLIEDNELLLNVNTPDYKFPADLQEFFAVAKNLAELLKLIRTIRKENVDDKDKKDEASINNYLLQSLKNVFVEIARQKEEAEVEETEDAEARALEVNATIPLKKYERTKEEELAALQEQQAKQEWDPQKPSQAQIKHQQETASKSVFYRDFLIRHKKLRDKTTFCVSHFFQQVDKGEIKNFDGLLFYVVSHPNSRAAKLFTTMDMAKNGEFAVFVQKHLRDYQSTFVSAYLGRLFTPKSHFLDEIKAGLIKNMEQVQAYAKNHPNTRTARLKP